MEAPLPFTGHSYFKNLSRLDGNSRCLRSWRPLEAPGGRLSYCPRGDSDRPGLPATKTPTNQDSDQPGAEPIRTPTDQDSRQPGLPPRLCAACTLFPSIRTDKSGQVLLLGKKNSSASPNLKEEEENTYLAAAPLLQRPFIMSAMFTDTRDW